MEDRGYGKQTSRPKIFTRRRNRCPVMNRAAYNTECCAAGLKRNRLHCWCGFVTDWFVQMGDHHRYSEYYGRLY